MLLAIVLVAISRAQAIVAEAAKLLSHFRPLYGWGQRQYIKNSLEFRVRRLHKRLQADAPFLTEQLAISWIDPQTPREAFLSKGNVVVRLRSNDRYDQNLVHATCLFVSTSLLFRAKRYLAQDQKESLDLYVAAKLLEQANEGVVDVFLGDYLLPRTEQGQSQVAEYFSAYETLNRAGLFYGVLLKELDFLGRKVFGRRFIPELPAEVDEVVDLLETIALRSWRQRVELTLYREYCRVAVVIVGMQEKLEEGVDPWVTYIERALVPRNTESIYLLGLWRNRSLLEAVAGTFSDRYDAVTSQRSTTVLADGIERDVYICALRRRDPSVFQPRIPERRRRLASKPSVAVALPRSQEGTLLGSVLNFGSLKYGFIELDDNEEEVFFHLKDCIDPPPFIAKGDRVDCRVRSNPSSQRPSAYDVRFLRLAPTDKPRAVLAAQAHREDPDDGGAQSAEEAGGVEVVVAEEEKAEIGIPTGRQPAEVVSFGKRQFGFLRLADGREAFFHLNDCLQAPPVVSPGAKVTCELDPTATSRLKARNVDFGVRLDGAEG